MSNIFSVLFQIWTDDDLAKLTKLMKRYPGGSNERWEKIADVLERYPWEVTKMAKKVKDNAYMVGDQAGHTHIDRRMHIERACLLHGAILTRHGLVLKGVLSILLR